jgi:pilus assembly protein CpaB
MKWSVVGLLVLGLIAAVSAALLVTSLEKKSKSSGAGSTPVVQDTQDHVLVAPRDLEARSIVSADAIATKDLPLGSAPGDALKDPAQVVGKVLLVPLKAGELFTSGCFAREGFGMRLASAVAHGMRAVNVQLSDSMGLEPLLYPGSVVDVLATVKMPNPDDTTGTSAGAPVSVTLLQAVTVLGVGDKTVVSTNDGESRGILDRGPRPSVTLLVDPEQAEMLKLAMQEGSISLTLRNPMDSTESKADGVGISALSPILAKAAEFARQRAIARDKERLEQAQEERQKRDYEMEKERYAIERARSEMEIARMQFERQKIEAENAAKEAKAEVVNPQWETLILRGGQPEKKTFDIPQTEKPEKKK